MQFEKTYATKQKKRKMSRFLDFEKKRKTRKNVKVITCKVLETALNQFSYKY